MAAAGPARCAGRAAALSRLHINLIGHGKRAPAGAHPAGRGTSWGSMRSGTENRFNRSAILDRSNGEGLSWLSSLAAWTCPHGLR